MITPLPRVLDDIYLREEDALVFSYNNFTPIEKLYCFSQLEFSSQHPNVIQLANIPDLVFHPNFNDYTRGTVTWLLQTVLNALISAMDNHKIYDLYDAPAMVLRDGEVKLCLPNYCDEYKFKSQTLSSFLNSTFPSKIDEFCKDACLQEPKYTLPQSDKGDLVRKEEIVTFNDITFRRSILYGSIFDVFEKTFNQILIKFVPPVKEEE